jgi:hypothetical protein
MDPWKHRRWYYVTRTMKASHGDRSHTLCELHVYSYQVHGTINHQNQCTNNSLTACVNQIALNPMAKSRINKTRLAFRTLHPIWRSSALTQHKIRNFNSNAKANVKHHQAIPWVEPQGKRKVGWPRQTWRRGTNAEAREFRMSWARLKRAPENCVRWRSVVAALCSLRNKED